MNSPVMNAEKCYDLIISKATNNGWIQGLSGVAGFPFTLMADAGVIPGIYWPMWNNIRALYGHAPVSEDDAINVIKGILPEVIADFFLDKVLGNIPLIGIYFNAICAKAMTWRLGILFSMLSARGSDIGQVSIGQCMALIRNMFPKRDIYKYKKPDWTDLFKSAKEILQFITPDKDKFVTMVASVSNDTPADFNKKQRAALEFFSGQDDQVFSDTEYKNRQKKALDCFG